MHRRAARGAASATTGRGPRLCTHAGPLPFERPEQPGVLRSSRASGRPAQHPASSDSLGTPGDSQGCTASALTRLLHSLGGHASALGPYATRRSQSEEWMLSTVAVALDAF